MLKRILMVATVTLAIAGVGAAQGLAGPANRADAEGFRLGELLGSGLADAQRPQPVPGYTTVHLDSGSIRAEQVPSDFALMEDEGMTLADAVRDIEWRRRAARNLDRLFHAR